MAKRRIRGDTVSSAYLLIRKVHFPLSSSMSVCPQALLELLLSVHFVSPRILISQVSSYPSLVLSNISMGPDRRKKGEDTEAELTLTTWKRIHFLDNVRWSGILDYAYAPFNYTDMGAMKLFDDLYSANIHSYLSFAFPLLWLLSV